MWESIVKDSTHSKYGTVQEWRKELWTGGKTFLKSVFEQKVEKKGYFQQFLSVKELLLITFGKLCGGVVSLSPLLLYSCRPCVYKHILLIWKITNPVNNYLFKVNNTGSRKSVCSKLTIQAAEIRQLCRSGDFIVNSKICNIFFYVLLLTSNK